MDTSLKKRLKIVLAISIGVVLLLFGLQWFIQNKVENYLKNELPNTMVVAYSDLSFHIFSGDLKVNNMTFYRFGEVTNDTLIAFKVRHLRIDNVGYWQYLFNNTVRVSNIELDTPDVIYKHNAKIKKASYKLESNKPLNTAVKVADFKITGAYIQINNVANDSLIFKMKNAQFSLKNIHVDEKTQKQKIPLVYEGLELLFDNLFFRMSDYDDLRMGKSSIQNNQITFNDVSLKTKYSKEKLSRIIKVERDYFNVMIPSLKIKDFNYGFRQDSILQIKSPQVLITKIEADIYRDKLVTDDLSIKPLYSKMLRDLKFDLAIDELKITDSKIRYQEKVKADRQAGTINFNDFQATIKNVSNTYVSPTKTTLDIKTRFMDHAPLHANWEFDVNDKTDRFLFQAEVNSIKAAYLNKFVEPNLNARLEGELEETYLTINGNDHISDIDFKTKYQNFDVILLKQDGKEKNAFLSDVINIFISKTSKNGQSQYRNVTKTDIVRNKNKSVFNYIWINTREGLKKAIMF